MNRLEKLLIDGMLFVLFAVTMIGLLNVGFDMITDGYGIGWGGIAAVGVVGMLATAMYAKARSIISTDDNDNDGESND